MTQEEITALAREYAEEYIKRKYPDVPSHIRERIVEGRLEHMEDFIPWLLRRYCLVEKGAVRKEYREAKIRQTYLERFSAQWGAVTSKMAVLERIFPDLGKEVES